MLDAQKILSRLSVPGVAALVVGALLGFFSKPLSAFLFKERAERFQMPVKWVGLALTVFGALVLLDFIPGLE